MFMKINQDRPELNTMFRDKFRVNLNKELFGRGKEVQEIIEALFNLDNVLEIDPITCGLGCPPRDEWVILNILTKPIHNKESVEEFEDYLNGLTCVTFAQGVYSLKPTAEETKEYVYGGKRSKL